MKQRYIWYNKVGNDYIAETDIFGKPEICHAQFQRYVKDDKGDFIRDEKNELVFKEGMYVSLKEQELTIYGGVTRKIKNRQIDMLKENFKDWKIHEGNLNTYCLTYESLFKIVTFYNDVMEEANFNPQYEKDFFHSIHKEYLDRI